MRYVLICIFLFYQLKVINTSNISIGIIKNVSLIALGSQSAMMNGSCHDCLCAMLINPGNVTSFNCFLINNTCQLFSYYSPKASPFFINNSTYLFYFHTYLLQYSSLFLTNDEQSTSRLLEATTNETTITTNAVPTNVIQPTTSNKITPFNPASLLYPTLNCTSSVDYFVTYDKTTAPSSWTLTSYTFNATSAQSTLLFSLQSNNHRSLVIDNVTVVALNNPSVSLLINGDFEYKNLTGWDLRLCGNTCSANLTSSLCDTANACYYVPEDCTTFHLLQQTFVTVIKEKYNVSFLIKASGIGGSNSFHVKTTII
ncbi:hypothetical protein I4U23_028114 [Adineta vaga]|nr:hypothetical protein I4U23_028114 [Adineta vaga]